MLPVVRLRRRRAIQHSARAAARRSASYRQSALHASRFIGFSRRFAIGVELFRGHVICSHRRVGRSSDFIILDNGNQKIGFTCNLIRMLRQIVSNLLYSRVGNVGIFLVRRIAAWTLIVTAKAIFSRRGYEYETTRTGGGSLMAAVLLVVARHAARTCAYGAGSRAAQEQLRVKLTTPAAACFPVSR